MLASADLVAKGLPGPGVLAAAEGAGVLPVSSQGGSPGSGTGTGGRRCCCRCGLYRMSRSTPRALHTCHTC